MDVITLVGVSNKGKNLIRLHGNEWVILERRDNVPCLNGDSGFLIAPKGKETESRWWSMWGDKDFQHIGIKDEAN